MFSLRQSGDRDDDDGDDREAHPRKRVVAFRILLSLLTFVVLLLSHSERWRVEKERIAEDRSD